MNQSKWRLIYDIPNIGSWNMAVDEAILDSVINQTSPPTLRLYAWDPPTLSLGYAQSISDIDFEKLNNLGWGIVRRPTGGKAILHTDELTYSVIAPLNDPCVTGSVLESYKRVSEALINALNHIGLQAIAQEQYANIAAKNLNPICFEIPSNYEITFDGKKLIGSAQARRKNAVLQHGSLPLYGDLTRITKVLNYSSEEYREEASNRLLNRATTVERSLLKFISWDEAAFAFEQAFRNTFGLQLEMGILSQDEINSANKIFNEKHNNTDWINRI